MNKQNKIVIVVALLLLSFALSTQNSSAKDREYAAIVKHLKAKYQAKKVKIPFMGLARFVVGFVKPAGVKSFNLTTFKNLNITEQILDEEMQSSIRNTLGEEWNSVLRVRSGKKQQVYLYLREIGESVKLILVTINNEEAIVVRARFGVDKLLEFIENPQIFGISLKDNEKETEATKNKVEK